MFENRDLFYKIEQVHNSADIPQVPEEKSLEETSLKTAQNSGPMIEYLLRIYQQSKQLSQIIAYIWRWADKGEEDSDSNEIKQNGKMARQLKEYFDQPTKRDNPSKLEISNNLKKLLKANPKTNTITDESIEAKLLKHVFGKAVELEHYIFPMFDKLELGEDPEHPYLGYLFEVNVNSFHGFLQDPDSSSPNLFKFNIPYPPRPTNKKTTVDDDTLEKWYKDTELPKQGTTERYKYFADNPYIPTTCS